MAPKVDLTGQRFGIVSVLEKLTEKKGTSYLYLCKCDCGNIRKYTSNILKSGIKSCGCQQFKGRPKDITGKKKNMLTAIESTGRKSGNGDYIWKFQCDCGNTTETTIGRFNSNHTKSCGCKMKDIWLGRDEYHGGSKTKTYKSWMKMLERCYDPSSVSYDEYGERGILVCEEWKNSYKNFLKDMGERPEGCTLDRIDNTKGYFKENCRWATHQQQARNNYGLPRNNTTGVKGVMWDEKSPGKWYACAQWRDLEGKVKKASFSVKKYGEKKAFEMAVEARKNAIEELNKLGADYSEQHTGNYKR